MKQQIENEHIIDVLNNFLAHDYECQTIIMMPKLIYRDSSQNTQRRGSIIFPPLQSEVLKQREHNWIKKQRLSWILTLIRKPKEFPPSFWPAEGFPPECNELQCMDNNGSAPKPNDKYLDFKLIWDFIRMIRLIQPSTSTINFEEYPY